MSDDIVTRLQARCCLLASQSPNDEGALLAIQAANEISRLRTENEKLREGKWECYEGLKVQVSILKEDKAFLQKRVSELEAGNEKLRAEIVEALTAWRVDREENEKLRAALKPFADAWEDRDRWQSVINIDDLRAAAAALKENDNA